MEARENKISQRMAGYSDQDIAAAYKEIVGWWDTGVLTWGPSKLREIGTVIREEMGLQEERYVKKEAERAVLEEASRRFYNMVVGKSRYADLKDGDEVWYADRENGEIEHGTICGVRFRNGELYTFAVDFDGNDFDEFRGEAMGKDFFLTEEEAGETVKVGRRT